MITFAVIGHNEAATLEAALRQAMDAAGVADDVVFVDSASTDESRNVAADVGATVWSAPLGKGRAMRVAFERSRHPWIVFLDADIVDAEHNIAGRLAYRVRQEPMASAHVGDFTDPMPGGVLSNTWGIYEPLAEALFPEVVGKFGSKPLTGFRAIRTDIVQRPEELPWDFGIEAHLNVVTALSGSPIGVVKLGWYEGRFLYKPTMGREIGRALLDMAERTGRLKSTNREAWDGWVDKVVEVVASYRGDPNQLVDYRARLGTARSRPLPVAAGSEQPRPR